MAFTINLNINAGNTPTVLANTQAGLGKVTVAAGQARNAMGQLQTGAAAAGAAGQKAGEDTAKGMDKARASAESHGDTLNRLIHLAEAYFAVHQVESLVDGYVEIRNKTNSVATSAENLNALMNEQFRVAQETRASWEGLASTYQRISNASRSLGLSQRQVIDLTEELSMGLRLSGSSSFEAMMTMQELTHAFTVGTLTGREYKVMMKDAPALMHELQVVSGKTGPQFAEMGKHGKMTAEVLIEWFGKARDTIKEKFGQTIPTIGEGLLLIRNAAQKFFGEAGLGTGVVQKLGEAMRFVADHFETVGKVVLSVVEAMLALFVIEKIIGLVKALTVAIAANPLGAILTALTVGIALLRQFGDEMETTTRTGAGFVTIGDTMAVAWTELKRLAGSVFETVSNAVDAWRNLFSGSVDTDGVEKSTTTVTDLINKMVTIGIGSLRFLGDTVVTIFGGIPASIGEMFVEMARGVIGVVQNLINAIIKQVNALIDTKNAIVGTLDEIDGPMGVKRMAREGYDKIAREAISNPSEGYKTLHPRENILESLGMKSINDPLTKDAKEYVKAATGFDAPDTGETPHIKPLDLSFTTALDGAAAAFDRKIKEDWQRDIVDGVSRIEAESVKHAQERQFARMQAAYAYKGDAISTVGGKPDAKLPDEKAAKAAEKAYEKMVSQLRTITEASNPQSDAIAKLAHAHEILEKAVSAVNPKTKEHLITTEAAAKVYADYKAKLEDQIHPFDAWIRKQTEASAALRSTSEEQERAGKLAAFVADMRQKTGGLGASAEQIAIAEKRIALDQKHAELMHAEQGFTSALLGPQKTYRTQLAALGDLLEHQTISAAQYARAVDGVREAYLAADPALLAMDQRVEMAWLKAKAEAEAAGVAAKDYSEIVDEVRAQQLAAGPEGRTFAGGLEMAWLKAKEEARSFGNTLATQLVGDLDKFNEAFIAMANGGSVAWGKMIDDMIQGLERLIVKQLEVAAINAIIAAATGTPVPGAGQAIVGSGALPDPGIPRVATAGSALPGAYPTSSVSLRSASGQGGAPPTIILENHNHIDSSVTFRHLDSPEGRRITVNHVRAEKGALTSFSGTSR